MEVFMWPVYCLEYFTYLFYLILIKQIFISLSHFKDEREKVCQGQLNF